jgi:hypothetical protein
MMDMKDFEKKNSIKIRISIIQKEKWKKACSEKQMSLTSLIINSVESRMMDDERRKILTFIEKQDNIFGKIENNINQVAKIANGQKFISEKELTSFSIKLDEVANLKKQQNEIFIKIFSLIANDS